MADTETQEPPAAQAPTRPPQPVKMGSKALMVFQTWTQPSQITEVAQSDGRGTDMLTWAQPAESQPKEPAAKSESSPSDQQGPAAAVATAASPLTEN